MCRAGTCCKCQLPDRPLGLSFGGRCEAPSLLEGASSTVVDVSGFGHSWPSGSLPDRLILVVTVTELSLAGVIRKGGF